MYEDLEIDKINRQLIIELQKDSRQSNRRLASTLGVVEDTVKRRIEHLVSSGSLHLTVLPELKKMGLPVRAFIMLDVDHFRLDDIAQKLCHMNSLRFVGRCIGFSRLNIRGDFASNESMVDFMVKELGKIDGITIVETKIEYEEIKKQYIYLEMKQPTGNQTTQTPVSISQTDRELILRLQKNARAPLKEIATSIGLSEATVHRRIKELVHTNVIRFTAIPKPSLFGYGSGCAVHIQAKPDRIRSIALQIIKHPNIAYVGITSGSNQISATVFAPSVEGLSKFVKQEIEKIDGVVKITAITFMEVLKQRYTWFNK